MFTTNHPTVSPLRTLFAWLRPSRFAPDAAPQPALTYITITAADMAAGKRRSANACPLALACNRELGGTWLIQPPYAVHLTDHYKKAVHVLSETDIAWVNAWDRDTATMHPRVVALQAPGTAPGKAYNITL
jgi:hypothetical protein